MRNKNGKHPFCISAIMAHLSEEKSAEQKLTTSTNNVVYETKAYKKRWYILAVFIWYSGINAYQWVEYTIVNDLVAKYYGVSSIAVDWTAIIYMFLYPFFVVPASYIIDKKVTVNFVCNYQSEIKGKRKKILIPKREISCIKLYFKLEKIYIL